MTGNANTFSSSFIDCIIDRMIELNISQSELARRMKVSSPYVTKLLNRDVNLSFGTAPSSPPRSGSISCRCSVIPPPYI